MKQDSSKKMLFEMMNKVTGMELKEEYNDYKQLGVTPSLEEFRDEYGNVLRSGVNALEVAIGKLFTMTKEAIGNGLISPEEGVEMIESNFEKGRAIHPVLSDEYVQYLKMKLTKFIGAQ